jgi:hypothetical protein
MKHTVSENPLPCEHYKVKVIGLANLCRKEISYQELQIPGLMTS